MTMAELTGLEMMKRASSTPWGAGDQGIVSIMPMKVVEAEEGRIIMHARADQRHCNPFGMVHGGFAATIMDGATGCAVCTVLAVGETFSTVDLNIKMVRPVPFEEGLVAVGKVIDRTKNLAFSEAELKDASSNVLAHATATCRISKLSR